MLIIINSNQNLKSNINLHIIFLSILFITNIFLFSFIMLYKSKITNIKFKLNNNSLQLNKNQNNYIQHKLVNIFATSMGVTGKFHFSLIFQLSEELNTVKGFVNTYKRLENPFLLLIYQGYVDSDKSTVVLDIIKYYTNILIIIETKNKQKFGFFFNGKIFPNKKDYFISNSHKCLLFSLSEKEKYYCNLKNRTFEVNNGKLFNIGDGDILINYNYHKYGGKINFPFKTFDIPENEGNIFKKLKGTFDIKDIEIYVVIDEKYDFYDLRKIMFS